VQPEGEAAGEDEIAGEPGEAVTRPEPRRWTGRGVRILRPEGGRAVGPVDVEVEGRLPPDRRLERLEIFWNEELAATLYKPPFREKVTIPPSRQAGYLRAAARLDDGSTAEDAVLLNASAVGERLEVRLVELYVVVTDRDGRPVTGLSRNDFRLLQDGREQDIASFDEAGESPLLLGLAFDSSASMFIKLPDVQKAARELLAGGLARKDRALLVDFDTAPRLVVGATGDLAQVSAGLRALHADGSSNLFQAVLFSLEQLGRLSGRRALIIYSDGIGEGEGGYRSCLRTARKSGLPVYLIVTNTRAARNAGGGLLSVFDSYATKLERLAAATGGRAYFVLPDQDLGGVYQEILRELRSQYLLAYYPHDAAPEVWRKVDVELKKHGLRARTVSGYYGR
jgi:Ca-activated chloride channel family protein